MHHHEPFSIALESVNQQCFQLKPAEMTHCKRQNHLHVGFYAADLLHRRFCWPESYIKRFSCVASFELEQGSISALLPGKDFLLRIFLSN